MDFNSIPYYVNGLGSLGKPTLWQAIVSEGWKPSFYKIADAFKRAKALRRQESQYANAIAEIKKAIAQADTIIGEMEAYAASKGISGLGSWFQRTFTPRKNAKRQLNKTIANFETFEKELNEKLDLIQALQKKIDAYEAKQISIQQYVEPTQPGVAPADQTAMQPALIAMEQTTQAGGMGLAMLGILAAGGYFLSQRKKSSK